MESNLPSWTKYVVAVAVVAILVVVVRHYQHQADQEAWAVVGSEGVLQGDIEALEAAREQAKGSSASTLLSLMLAQQLYENGGQDNFQRAAQVAREALDQDGSHALAPHLQRVLEAVESFEVAPAADA